MPASTSISIPWRMDFQACPDARRGLNGRRTTFSDRPKNDGWAWKRVLLLGVTLGFLAGCQKTDDIVRYTVAKQPGSQGVADTVENKEEEWIPGQLLGAIIPQGGKTWFFKLTGPVEPVKSHLEPFLKFVKSIRLSETGPEWSLPDGWEQLPGTKIRFATLKIATENKPLELSVIPLPTVPGDFDDYLLSNVNRWREQIRLGPISKDELPSKTMKVELEGTSAWLVIYEGLITDSGTGAAPFAGRQPLRREAPSARAGQESLPFTCQVPEGWQTGQANQMQLAAYQVRDGERQVAISVSTARGDLASNINRWREQVHLAPVGAANLEKELQKITVDGREGVFVELVGPETDPKRETLLGVIVAVQGEQWFFKLKGDVMLAARERERFEAFVQSIRFRGTK
jgi:hypothetical protein